MTDQAKILYEHRRMCKAYPTCEGCSLASNRNGVRKDCWTYILSHPEQAAALILKWASEHPEPHQKTYAEDYLEKHPNARKISDGTPGGCVRDPYGYEVSRCECACHDCWNQPMRDKP
jgi:hypothetical protein